MPKQDTDTRLDAQEFERIDMASCGQCFFSIAGIYQDSGVILAPEGDLLRVEGPKCSPRWTCTTKVAGHGLRIVVQFGALAMTVESCPDEGASS